MLLIPTGVGSARSTSIKVVFAFIVLFLLSPLHPTPAQSPKATPTPPVKVEDQEVDPDDIISVNTTEVLLPVTVRDSSGQLVEG